jgi:hypothetical protein
MASVRKQELSLVRLAARVCVQEVQTLMRTSPATGRVYPSRTGKGMHRASAPGEPPAVDTGALVKSIGATVTETARGGTAVVGSRLPKAIWRFLEYGTANIKPRPSARPAFLKTMVVMQKHLKSSGGATRFTGEIGTGV